MWEEFWNNPDFLFGVFYGTSTWQWLKKWKVRVFSLDLVNLYKFIISVKNINNLKSEDDTAFLADAKMILQGHLDNELMESK